MKRIAETAKTICENRRLVSKQLMSSNEEERGVGALCTGGVGVSVYGRGRGLCVREEQGRVDELSWGGG